MTNTAVQDPSQISNTTNPTERDKKTVPLEIMWERQFEQEKSLSTENIIEAKDNDVKTFQANGSIDFKIQVEDKSVTAQEMQSSNFTNYDLFFKPLEGATNIVGTVINEAPDIFDAAKDLKNQILGVTEKQTEIQPEKQKEVQVTQWQNFVIQKTGETNAAISKVTMQREMEETLYIVGAPPTEDTAAELKLNTGMDAQTLNTIDKNAWRARKRSEDMKAAKNAEEAQDEAEVQGPKPVANMNEVMEGGLIGGAQAHIGPVNAGG